MIIMPLLNSYLYKSNAESDLFKLNIIKIIFLFLTIWTLPWPFQFPGPGLDPSWLIGINRAISDNLQFGEDIAFTFGPLGFIWGVPLLLDYNLWRFAFIFAIFSHALFIYSIYMLIKQPIVKCNICTFILFLLTLIISINTPLFDYKLNISAGLLLYIFLTSLNIDASRKYKYLYMLLVALILAISSLTKFHMFILSISTILTALMGCIILKRNLTYLLFLMLSYPLLLGMLWITAGQEINNFPQFIYNGLEITSGYSDAMAIGGPSWQISIAIITLISIASIFIIKVLKRDYNLITFLVINLGILFVSFKHGFVRQDLHVLNFYYVYLLIFGLLLIINNKKTLRVERYMVVGIVLLLSCTIIYITPGALSDNVMNKVESYEISVRYLFIEPSEFDSDLAIHKEFIRYNYGLDQSVIDHIGNKSVDIFPWDIALCEAYGLNWFPRPVFQSYSAYTKKLDYLNSQHFVGKSSPQLIFYSYKSIDGRYPLFDEPSTFQEVLFKYSYAYESDEFVLLEKSSNMTNDNRSEIYLGNTTAKLGQIIKIPEYNGLVFGYLHFDYSPLGKIMKLLYKPAPAYITFELKNSTDSAQIYRFLPNNAKNGVLLSHYVGNSEDLAMLFKRQLPNNLDGISIETDDPSHYYGNIYMQFIGISQEIHMEDTYKLYRLYHPLLYQQYIASGIGIINNESKYIIFEHPVTSIDKPMILINNIYIQENAKLKFSIGLDPHVWSSENGDGVIFEIYINVDGIDEPLFSEYIDPKNNHNERKWNEFELDLSQYADKYATITLSTLPGNANDSRYDWAWWGEPIIYNDIK